MRARLIALVAAVVLALGLGACDHGDDPTTTCLVYAGKVPIFIPCDTQRDSRPHRR